MATRIRTLNFLPEIFQTPTNNQFLRATLDQVVQQPETRKVEGYVGSKFGYGVNAKDYYVTEPNKVRTDYQLDPGVIFTKTNESTAKDFISYPGIIDALKLEGAITDNNNRLFESEIYSWDSFTNLDKLINFNQYYWIPQGPASVNVSTETVFNTDEYNVTSQPNGYTILPTDAGTTVGVTNPTLTLLRGGTYRFLVNQSTQFWIQGMPGVTGFSPTQPNLQTRDVLGVENNGITQGEIIFTVPQQDAQNEFNFPSTTNVDVVSSLPFSQVNNQLTTNFSIDSVSSLDGLTVMFYDTGISDEIGYVSNYFDLSNVRTTTVSATTTGTNAITCTNTSVFNINDPVIFTGTPIGGISAFSAIQPNTIYFVKSILSATQFTVSLTVGGTTVPLNTDTGLMTAITNDGSYQIGYNSIVNENFYTISYITNPNGQQVTRLIPTSQIPVDTKITAIYGSEYLARNFYKNSIGYINEVPYISAPLDTLYYQDGTINNKVGIIKLVENNLINILNVTEEILGKKEFTSTNGVTFTNGLKVSFQGDVIPTTYLNTEFYVEGVGVAIELIPVNDFVVPEQFSSTILDPWDTVGWDETGFEGSTNIPLTPDYITIARNSIDKNAWSRSNRWFHIDVINATANYNNNQNLITEYTTNEYKAKRPIIEFYPNLKLLNYGTEGKTPVDFIDTRTTDALSLVAGKENYYPDIEVYTNYSCSITTTNYTPTRYIQSASEITGIFTLDTGYNTDNFRINDLITFSGLPLPTGILNGAAYYIKQILGGVGGTTFTISTTKDGELFKPSIAISGVYEFTWAPQSTTITVPANQVLRGTFAVGQYVSDSNNVLPNNTQILSISGSTTLTLTVGWNLADIYFGAQSNVSLVGSDTPTNNFGLFEGSTVIFANDLDANVRNKIYVSRFSTTIDSDTPVITLTEIENGDVLPDNQTIANRGFYNIGKEFYYDGIEWIEGQQKITVNQAPLYDIFDNNNISYSNPDVYLGTSFAGNKLFAYGIGDGVADPILAFPIRYSSVNNIGDISFDVSINTDSFNYVVASNPVTQKVNTGYVFSYVNRMEYVRQIGWQTAISPSIQYQSFQFNYDPSVSSTSFVCDVSQLPTGQTNWPTILVYINNNLIRNTEYSIAVGPNSTTVTLNAVPVEETVIQILLASNQVSKTAYYTIPLNLNNNPLNSDIEITNLGEIRGQYQSMFDNNPNTTGQVFGRNNFRDLGNMVPYGNKIIQNSASLVLPGALLRGSQTNLFNSLIFNSREYVKFKNLLAYTIQNTDYSQRFDPSFILDDALDQITASKTSQMPFFWSDMLPGKAAYKINTYTFNNSLDTSIFPLDQIYDFTSANYNGVLVYLTRVTNNISVVRQLIKGVDYTVSDTSPSLTITLDLQQGDKITIKQYNQTYGSYVPNTPTKLGLYPLFVPNVVLDENYINPTYFIKGHDGSYTKLYGEYDAANNILIDFRDQALLEFELRIYNNIKLSTNAPITLPDVIPGFFRETTYSYDEWLSIYSYTFLEWVGQNRLDYKTQFYVADNSFTYNYSESGNKVNKAPIQQGFWRGIYQYFFDTTTPESTPWEMLGFANKPSWWENRYGPAPYTSDNLVLWTDLSEGIIWNNGVPYVDENYVRDGLLNIIPVNSLGELLSPIDFLISSYNEKLFRRNWKVGDDASVELSYRRSSTYPFDVIRLMALTQPAKFYNLAVDMDNYKYSEEFNQYLVNNRSHLIVNNIQVYGNGTAKTSYLNWIVDYQKQAGIDATTNITTLLNNLDVRLVYRLAGFSDKKLLKFYVEKGTPYNSNDSLLIPDESYAVLLYENQPFNRILYSSVIVQLVSVNGNTGYALFGNSFGNAQTNNFFNTLKPKYSGRYKDFTVEDLTIRITGENFDTVQAIPYGSIFYSVKEVCQFLSDYGAYLVAQGMQFNEQENELTLNWDQMIAEFMYWSQMGWEVGSVITLNPSAKKLVIEKDSNIVQPLTFQQTNFLLNQNLYAIQPKDLAVIREGVKFSASALNDGDTISYGQFNLSNFEHGIVFDNLTIFNDVIYNLVSGLRQLRVFLRGTKSAAWDGLVNAGGFIYNQDNIQEWNRYQKYAKGEIVTYKNKYWVALKLIQPSEIFRELDWKRTDYNEVQKGLLPNSSTNSVESLLYYDVNSANLELDADLLSFSLIGFRPRQYMSLADLTDITQVNVYKNLIKNKGTKNAVDAFKGANLPQGGINYDVYENWAIKTGEFGGVLNNNFIEFKVNQSSLTGNPAYVSLTNGESTPGSQQEVPIYALFNYDRPINTAYPLPTIAPDSVNSLFPSAGYVNFNDVKMSAFYYSQMPIAVNKNQIVEPLENYYVRDYAWVANYKQRWEVFTPIPIGRVIFATNNLNDTVTIIFEEPHNLSQYQPFAIVNFDTNINGYYIALLIVDPTAIIINKTLDQSISAITGEGIGLLLSSQRVATPSDINTLPLLNFEFTKNTVWVDTNTDGSWGVYRKNINYLNQQQFTKSGSQSLGSAVALTSVNSYLIGDRDDAKAYHYIIDPLTGEYIIEQTISGTGNFGYAISYVDDIYAIVSESSDVIKLYQLQRTKESQNFVEIQSISVTGPESLVFSNDQKWLYVGIPSSNDVKVYQQSYIPTNAGYFVSGQTYIITEVGSTDFTLIGATSNTIGVIFNATGVGTGTGTATKITYNLVNTIDGDTLGLTSAGDSFGFSVSTDYYGNYLVVGTPNKDFNTLDNWGYSYIFNRTTQNFEVQANSVSPNAELYPLAWTPITITKTVTQTASGTNLITLNNTTSLNVNDAIVFTSTTLPLPAVSGLNLTNIIPYKVYYINSISGSDITIKESRDSTTPVNIASKGPGTLGTIHVQSESLFVYRNGRLVTDQNYGVFGSTFAYSGNLAIGDILTVTGNNFVLHETLTTEESPQIGAQFGYSVDTNNFGNEVLIGAPFQLNTQFEEGTVYRYTNGGLKYGQIIGENNVNVTVAGIILLNGYLINIPTGNAQNVADAINTSLVTNVNATALNGKLVIGLVNPSLAQINNKLEITVVDTTMLTELGINLYTKTQEILCPHKFGPTQFGSVVKFNEFDSVAISAPVGTRFSATTFDFTDDENQDNDTIFDNNATQFIDQTPNYGAVYIFDYISQYNEALLNPGKFIYGQSVNSNNIVFSASNTYDQDNDITYSNQPKYGLALDFSRYNVIVGSPNDVGATTGFEYAGSVTTFTNNSGTKNWNLFRYSAPIVDINRIFNIQLFSAETNNTLINLDYIDPLQNKILGAARENIDIISNTDPASYNIDVNTPGNIVWGEAQVGTLWLDTTNLRFVNYHQNDDLSYNGEYWATLFPGSDVAVYSWIASSVVPADYQGDGEPYQIDSYSTQFIVDSTDALVPVYYYWVRDTNIIFIEKGKTLADSIISNYIANPKGSGISYFAPIYQNAYGLYNSNSYFNANDSVLHIGFATGTNDDVSHEQVSLIRAGNPDDFLPGIPLTPLGTPIDLYDRLLDSLCGVDETGQIVPNPFLPKAVQLGVLARPRQTFFYNRYIALQNYLQFANSIIKQFSITTIRQNLSFLFEKNPEIVETILAGNIQQGTTYTIVTLGEVDWVSIGASSSQVGVTFIATGTPAGDTRNTGTASFVAFAEGAKYDTTDYWQYINWWVEGYSDATKPTYQVMQFADLAVLPQIAGTIAKVETNNSFNPETYILTANGQWTLIGIDNGTIEFKSSLYDYPSVKLGFGDNFFDTDPYDIYPSEETRNIIRALNEQIFTEDLLIYRNRGLILLFEYIQTETFENQNYLPWLNKTSFIDVSHTIRELLPIQVFQNDNQEFLSGYINEVKPYHVVIKEFLFKYTGTDVFAGDITDFDLPSQYNSAIQQFVTPQLVYSNPNNTNQFTPDSNIWNENEYKMWYQNRGLSIGSPITQNGATLYIGQQEFEIGILESYLATNTLEFAVSNAQGFPINGVIQIDDEKIAYSTVDRNLNVISGLTRGVDGTTITNHIPSATIFIDLPAVVVLDGGRAYVNPPKVTAFIDTAIYPEPTRQAVFTPVMSLDTVLSITVEDPGQGYAVTPEIVIEPALEIVFTSDEVNSHSNTIRLYAPLLQTGDLVQYRVGTDTTKIGGLVENSWYYINVLETIPSILIGLYTSYSDAIDNHNRVVLYTNGTGNNHQLNLGARAIPITNALPIRENIISLRFDRTTYNSDVTDWVPGAYYGSYYAGHYEDSNKLASSALLLQSTRPPISNVLASSQGVIFEIANVINESTITYSSFERFVEETIASTNAIRLVLQDDGSGNPNASGGTNGFYIGMPVKFQSQTIGSYNREATATDSVADTITLNSVVNIQPNDVIIFTEDIGGIIAYQQYYVLTVVGSPTNTITISETLGGTTYSLSTVSSASIVVEVGGLRFGTVYYVSSIISQTDFTVSMTSLGATIKLSDDTPNPYLSCYAGDQTNQAIATVYYNGIRTITQTAETTNALTIPLNPSGTGGTSGFYIGIPLFFTGTVPSAENNGVYGGIVENQPYFVTTIIDSENFTISLSQTPVTFTVTNTFLVNNMVIIDGDTSQLSINEPIIFNTMIIAGVETNNFGGLVSGTLYYVSSIVNSTTIKVSEQINGSVVILSDVTAASDTSALLTSQKDTVKLTNVNVTNDDNIGMVVNIDLPVSPGQIDGKLLTFYETSIQYPSLVGTVGNLIVRNVAALIGGTSNLIALTNFTEGVPDELFLSNIYDNMPIEISESLGSGFLVAGTTYYVIDKDFITVTVTETEGATDTLVCADTSSLFIGMPIKFSGTSLGGVSINVEFYVKEIVSSTQFKLTTIPNGIVYPLFSEFGTMIGTGLPYLKVATSAGGVEIDPGSTQQSASISVANPTVITVAQAPNDLTKIVLRNGTVPSGISKDVTYYVRNATGTTFNVSMTPSGALVDTSAGTPGTYTSTMVIEDDLQITQTPLVTAEFDASYILGGYRVVITDPGEGYAITNTITISGALLGGSTPTNDLVLTVNNIDSVGGITQVICAGLVPSTSNQYYVKVISNNGLALFENQQLTISANGLTLPYVGITTTTVTATTSSTNIITVNSTSDFVVNDAVVFTGDVAGNIVLGKTYYILSTGFTGTELKVSEEPNGSELVLSTTTNQSFSMAKSGSFAILPEPVVFNQSIVKFNNRVYSCIISNNDDEFVFGKWEELLSSDRRLNAMDRVKGYYDPTDNMPGVDLSQLFEGVIYPNSTYLGNPFAPDQQWPLDTILQDLPFNLVDVDSTSVVWDGSRYVVVSNLAEYSGFLTSVTGTSWQPVRLANKSINLTDIIYEDGVYVITSNNPSTPIFISQNGVDWTTSGYFTGYDDTPYDETGFDSTALFVSTEFAQFNSAAHSKPVDASRVVVGKRYIITTLGDTDWNIITNTTNVTYKVGDQILVEFAGYGTGKAKLYDDGWVVVGQSIVTSSDTYFWARRYAFDDFVETPTLFGVDFVDITDFRGYISVGRLQDEVVPGTLSTVSSLVLTSTTGEIWTPGVQFSTKGLHGITDNGTIAVAVGEDGVIYNSLDGQYWSGINRSIVIGSNPATQVLNVQSSIGLTVDVPVRFTNDFDNILFGTTYYVFEIVSNTQVRIAPTDTDTTAGSFILSSVYQITSLGTTNWNTVAGTVAITYNIGDIITIANAGSGDGTARELVQFTGVIPSEITEMFVYPTTATLLDVYYANSLFMAVGETGLIRTSSDGITWTTQTSGTTVKLNGVYYNDTDSAWIVVGDNDVIIISNDNGVTWISTSIAEQTTTYTVQGDPFTFGYGPEELVPGVISDNVTITVATRPGTNWDATEYAHVGYNVVSVELPASFEGQLTYSFNTQDVINIQIPAQLAVYIIDGTTNVATAIYVGLDYTVDWVENTITLMTPINFLPVTDKLRIDVYEVGNGNQLVKANTKTDPIRLNANTGWNEIYVNCNYSAQIYDGSGVIQPNNFPIEADAIETVAGVNTITVTDINKFVLNDGIEFQGTVFGGIQEGVTYYVKTISVNNSTITISDVFTGSLAGPTYPVTSGTGIMKVIIRPGFGGTWTPPIVYHNGTKLLPGGLQTVTRTKSGTNTVTVNSTAGFNVNDMITFSDNMFGTDLLPQTVYYIKSIVDSNEITLSLTPGGSVITLTDSSGGAECINNDYGFGLQPNGISAKIIFAKGTYDANVDYITYTLFGETLFEQYGYTIPETQVFYGDGTTGPYTLDNYVGQDNSNNTVVEVNGLRLVPTDYTIDFTNNELTFTSLTPTVSDTIAVTSYNFTLRQYFNTQYGVAGTTPDYTTVAKIANINNAINPYVASVTVTATTTGTNLVTCNDTTGFATGQTIVFYGTGFGNIVSGTVYYIGTVSSLTQFTITDENATVIPLSTASGLLIANAGGVPSVRVTTTTAHGLTTNDIVRIDGVGGSVQLNNNTYYVHVINSTQVDLYMSSLTFTLTSINDPIINVSNYSPGSGGYIWIADSYTLITDTVTDTTTDPILGNYLTISDTDKLTVGTPIIFTGTVFGNIVVNTTYYVKEILNSTDFTISETRGGEEFALTTASGTMYVTQWEQFNVDRLWVTVNGYRVPSSLLRLNPYNQVSILTEILAGDDVIITSMMPSATPNEEVFFMNVNSQNQASAYRANIQTRTWLTQPLYNTQDIIYLYDVTKITDTLVQNSITPAAVNGVHNVGLIADKNLISSITVYNNTKGSIISSDNYELNLINISPTISITSGNWIAVGDSLIITILQGNLIYINGEQIKYTTIDLINNTVSGLQRGTNGTGEQIVHPQYSEVFGILSNNRMSNTDYSTVWNSFVYNTTLGDPLQISNTPGAIFLRTDVS